ncbi:hypothetical protein NEF87_005096 [Candidatus Lokiarchaeum ossiferum]|uniref:Thaumarchaeal output domain-containing protein n=1 Tax=Candidatus Lokiarchaeum ossiferum TaxID=2951803 RepID=A0ABY6I201_9ARCH|nr:hypothetical protein NEF87_005096 [Candidatus Lokiarchaeum sp. B-35]
MMNLDPGPFLKVLHTVNSPKKVPKVIEKLRKKGYDPVFSIQNPKSGKIDIGIFDESRLNVLDQFNNSPRYKKEKCPICGKMISENQFFKCVNCDAHECVECGMKRLYNNVVPVIHTCGEDNFEFLGNIGQCFKCHQLLGFRAAPQTLRMKMIAKVVPSGQAMLIVGMKGIFHADKVYIENEIHHIFKQNRLLLSHLKDIQSEEKWFQTIKTIRSNYLRMGWSASYITSVLNKYIRLLNRTNQSLSDRKMQELDQYLQLMENLTLILVNCQDPQIYNQKIAKLLLEKNIMQLEPNVGKFIDISFFDALKAINECNTAGNLKSNLFHIRNHIENVVTLSQIDEIIENFPFQNLC